MDHHLEAPSLLLEDHHLLDLLKSVLEVMEVTERDHMALKVHHLVEPSLELVVPLQEMQLKLA